MLYLLFSISIFHHIIKPVQILFSLFYFFPFPLEGLASNDGSMSFGSSPLTENSLSARCCRVPPHFIPLSIRRDFNFSSPKTSISVALLWSSKSNGLSSWKKEYQVTKYTYYTVKYHDYSFKMNYNNLSQNLNTCTCTSMSFLTIIEINSFYLSFTIFQ